MHLHQIPCITPPHMLREIAERGSATQQEKAKSTLATSEGLRRQRLALGREAMLAGAAAGLDRERVVYDARQGTVLPGDRVRGEGDPPSGDRAVDEAYDGAGSTHDLYSQIYGRNSLDNNGMRLDSTVHYGQGYDNAFWNGMQMVYGDGDEDLPEADRLFNRFTIALDIIGHELTHGVIHFSAGLVYRDQPGALNESFADVFGALVKQRQLGQSAAQADWLIGAGLFTPNVNGRAIRSLAAPGTAYDDPVLGKDPQPAHMSDYKNVDYDNGGVHINSGIPNHAFYVTAREIGGSSWEKAGLIWYKTLTGGSLGTQASFQDAANLSYRLAGEHFGAGSLEQKAVRTGWAAVGIQPAATEDESGGDGGDGAGRRGCAMALAGLFLR